MNEATVFLYLKTLYETKRNDYKLVHALFHLHRYLAINNILNWERLFVFTKDSVLDDGEKKVMRNLMHHDMIDFKTHALTDKGLDFLLLKAKENPELNHHVDAFFEEYNGEFAYQNSCFYQAKNLILSCHLCQHHACLGKNNEVVTTKSPKTFLFKKPTRSFSN